jgi:pimeloyl-ACP methyl ester carboxylesterase
MEPTLRKRKGIDLEEKLLRFPSAPIHGLHRLSQEQVNMGPVESFHTYRLLSQPDRRGRVSRIFLMHNGLNETQKVGLYYQLASYLIEQDPGTVCVLRPFPGHLSRCAYPGLSETPLDHYLWDGLHLFRQFLRYMIETRWLLSTITRYSYYHCVSGSGLLGENKRILGSRLKTGSLAKEMREEWKHLNEASRKAVEGQGGDTPELRKEPPPDPAFRQAINSLRDALRLDHYPPKTGRTFTRRAEPELHVIGYSLGGFTAQSVFMSWPFLVSSCSTLLSGGAMRELAPTAFADPEEWQTVLHSLRYELDDAMMDFRFAGDEKGFVGGMEPGLFRYLKRTFYEVFEQEYRGSFQTRLVSFRQRMLFVVGGNDPIVRPQSVLDSGPPDGINLLAVGGIGHFLEGVARGKVEEEQRAFWLPEVGRTIGRLATNAAIKHRADLARTWLDEDDLIKEKAPSSRKKKWKELKRLEIAERLEVEEDGTLPNFLFQRALDDLLARAADDENNEEEKGLLFILKNEPPTFLLGPRALQQRANAMYHEDSSIVDYVRGVRLRRAVIEGEARDRICVVVPWNVPTILQNIDAGLQHPSQSESSGEQMGFAEDAGVTWANLLRDCKRWASGSHRDSIRVFDGRKGSERQVNERVDDESLEKLNEAACKHLRIQGEVDKVIPALPDCWVWMSNEFLDRAKGRSAPSVENGIQSLCREIPGYLGREKEKEVAESLRSDSLRIVSLSRARYNPRFRGRIVAEPRQAQELLLRLSLCIVTSVPFESFAFEAGPG